MKCNEDPFPYKEVYRLDVYNFELYLLLLHTTVLTVVVFGCFETFSLCCFMLFIK